MKITDMTLVVRVCFHVHKSPSLFQRKTAHIGNSLCQQWHLLLSWHQAKFFQKHPELLGPLPTRSKTLIQSCVQFVNYLEDTKHFVCDAEGSVCLKEMSFQVWGFGDILNLHSLKLVAIWLCNTFNTKCDTNTVIASVTLLFRLQPRLSVVCFHTHSLSWESAPNGSEWPLKLTQSQTTWTWKVNLHLSSPCNSTYSSSVIATTISDFEAEPFSLPQV